MSKHHQTEMNWNHGFADCARWVHHGAPFQSIQEPLYPKSGTTLTTSSKTPTVNFTAIPSGWWLSPTPLKNMSSSVGMMTFPICGKIKTMFQTTNQPISAMLWNLKGTIASKQWCCGPSWPKKIDHGPADSLKQPHSLPANAANQCFFEVFLCFAHQNCKPISHKLFPKLKPTQSTTQCWAVRLS